MKELITYNAQVKIVTRFIGKLIYVKANNLQYKSEVVNKLTKGGANVEVAKNWIKVDLFNGRTLVKVGDFELDLDILEDEDVETYLYNFYEAQYTKAGFKVEVKP